MASYRKRDGRWQVQVRRAGHRPVAKTFTSKTDARRWAAQVEVDLERSELPPDRAALKTLTLGDLLSRYQREVTPGRKGAVQEGYRLEALQQTDLARLSLVHLRPHAFARYRDDRLRIVKPATVLRELAIIRGVLNVARTDWGIGLTSNPLDEVTKPRPDPHRERRLEAGELDRLLEACRASQTPWFEPLVSLALETGMRRSELLRVRWNDVDLETRTLSIREAKNGHPRTIPLSSAAVGVLEGGQSPEAAYSDFVFDVSPNAVRLAWERMRRKAGIKNLRFHDLRHEAISRFFEKGLSMPEVAMISGHRDPRMLFRYTHPKAQEVARKLG